jgi:triacylglycerol lipase
VKSIGAVYLFAISLELGYSFDPGGEMNLVFASGLLFPQRLSGGSYFQFLPAKYPDACFPDVPVTGTVQERAEALAAQIAARFPNGEVNIVAHSMGGLDARYLLSHNLQGLANAGRVASLSTIATPHYGSAVADLLVGARPELEDPRRFAYDVVNRALAHLMFEFGALGDLTSGAAQQFNQQNPKLDHVRYFPYAGSGNGSFLLLPLHAYIESRGATTDEKTNDGLVSVASAKWPGDLVELPWPTDHVGEVGHNLNIGGKLKFDHLAAFDRVVQRIASMS